MNRKFYSHDASHEGASGGSDHPSEPHPKKGYPILLDGREIVFHEPKVKGSEILEKGGKLPLTCFSLYIKKKGCDFQKISLDEYVDLTDKEVEHFVTKEPDTYPYKVNNDPELTEEKYLTARKILTLAGVDPEKFYLIKVEEDGTNEVLAFTADEPIRMHCRGLVFITGEWLDVIDIEEYGKTCREVTPAKKYLIKVDKEKFPWLLPMIKAEAIIKMVVKDNPVNYNLVKFYSNSPKPVPVAFTAEVDLTEKCLLRFVVQPKTQNDGERREFSLPETDIEFLNTMGFRWEAHRIANYLWLLIHEYILPDGYQAKQCSVALMIPPAYPASEIDMAYFFPQLKKLSGTTIPAITNQAIDGQSYQRWSRHRQPGQWKPGVDCIATHLTLVNNWLENELKR